MSDVAAALKAEITRLAKKVVKQQVASLQATTTQQRKQIASLRRQITELDREVKALRRQSAKASASSPEPATTRKPHRFVAKGVVSLRKRLGLSAESFGKLVGVSGQTVYSWERKNSVPRAAQLAALAQVRTLGKREALRRLQETAE